MRLSTFFLSIVIVSATLVLNLGYAQQESGSPQENRTDQKKPSKKRTKKGSIDPKESGGTQVNSSVGNSGSSEPAGAQMKAASSAAYPAQQTGSQNLSVTPIGIGSAAGTVGSPAAQMTAQDETALTGCIDRENGQYVLEDSHGQLVKLSSAQHDLTALLGHRVTVHGTPSVAAAAASTSSSASNSASSSGTSAQTLPSAAAASASDSNREITVTKVVTISDKCKIRHDDSREKKYTF